MITPETFEALRRSGDRHAVLAPHVGGVRHVRFCIDGAGATHSAAPVEVVTAEDAAAIAAIAQTWSFKPFSPDGAAIPVCALLPLDPVEHGDRVPNVGDTVSRAGKHRTLVPHVRRGKGTHNVAPDRVTVQEMERTGATGFAGIALVCIDEVGHPEDVRVIKSTNYRDFDQAFVGNVMTTWSFEPVLVGGDPAPVCAPFDYGFERHTFQS
jgi:hypothetical protein